MELNTGDVMNAGDSSTSTVDLDLNYIDKLYFGPCHSFSYGYYFYQGSQTSPPCEQQYLWLILENPLSINDQQVCLLTLDGGTFLS